MSVIFGFFALLCGAVLTSQIASNALLGKLLGDSYIPAAVNMIIGMLTTAAILLIVHKPLPAATTAAAVPWWTWIAGGVLGTIYLTGTSYWPRDWARERWLAWWSRVNCCSRSCVISSAGLDSLSTALHYGAPWDVFCWSAASL